MLTSLALVFLLGLAAAALCSRIGLPRIIGMLLTGILIGPYVLNWLDDSILSISSELRQMTLIIVLLKAGLSLNLSDLRQVGRPAVLLSCLPATCELAGYILLAPYLLGVNRIEAAVMGAVLAAVSPAVVVPRMVFLMENRWGTDKSIPQMLLAGASCDDIYVIVLFTTFTGIAQGGNARAADFLNIPVSVLLGIAVGALNGVLIGVMNLPPFLATLCTCMITRGAGSLCSATPWPGLTQPGGWFHTIFKVTVGTGRSASRYPLGFLWMIILVLVMEYILNHTKFGRYTIAIGSNKEAAALSGINTKFYHVMVYVVCGLFTGLAAIAYAAVTPTVQPGTGAGLEMDAIGGVFVGGVAATGGYGSVIGTFVGIFVIMLLKTGLPYIGLQANWQQIITGIVLIVAVLIDILKEKKAAH